MIAKKETRSPEVILRHYFYVPAGSRNNGSGILRRHYCVIPNLLSRRSDYVRVKIIQLVPS